MTEHSQSPHIRVAIVGAGPMGQHHARAVAQADPAARVVAVADPSFGPDQTPWPAVPDARRYPSLEALLAAGGVDVVHIVTPPSTHDSLAKLALEAGVHVYVEKPFTEDERTARAILDLAATSGLKVCAGHQLLFEAPSLAIRPALPALGTITHVESYFSFRTVRRAAGGRTPLRADKQLLDILPHPVYLLLDMLERAAPGVSELAAIEVNPRGTVHALVRRGSLTATLIVTLDGRPVESYLRVVGRNGSLVGDFVRGLVVRQIGPGTSAIDKLLAPYAAARQLVMGTTRSVLHRVLARRRSYPGLAELFGAFYDSIQRGTPSPLSPDSILTTTRLCEQIAGVLRARMDELALEPVDPLAGDGVLVTGGTGFLGRTVVEAVRRRGRPVRVLARRQPPPWESVPGVDYVVANLTEDLEPGHLLGVETIIHCAAETAGGWEEHQKNSIDAVGRLLRIAKEAGVSRVVHVSSSAVLDGGGRPVVRDDDPLPPTNRGLGPYVWGKQESERLAVTRGQELGLDVKVVRPAALVDYRQLDPPGRLGKRLGNVFVAVGSPGQTLAVVDVVFAAEALAWCVDHWDRFPSPLNLLDPDPPTKRHLLQVLRRTNPDLSVVWLPTLLLIPLSWGAILAQKILRPGRPAINAARIFAPQRFDHARSASVAMMVADDQAQRPEPVGFP